MLRAKPKVKRNYTKERKYDSQPVVKKKRVLRNAARNKLLKAGVVKKYDGKDVHHVGGNALNPNSKLKAVSASKNRSYPRTKNARKLYRTSQENETMASKDGKPSNREEAILMIAKALGLKTDLGKKPTEKKNKGGLTGNMKKKTKYMAKGGYGTPTKKMKMKAGGATKKTKYMAKGGATKKTKYMARGGAAKRK